MSTNEQARIYQRANENLITQTVYLEQNLAVVKELRDKMDDPATHGDPSNDLQDIPKITSNFCDSTLIPTGGTNYTDAIRCLDQFREIRSQELRDLRVSVVQNDDAIAKLRGNLSSSKNKSGSSNQPPVYRTNIKARVFPKIPTFQDLSTEAYPEIVKQGYLPALKQKEALEFATRLMNPPDCSQFVETSEALVDPDDPGAGTFHVIVRDEKGNPKINAAACKQAQKTYAKMQSLRTMAGGQTNLSNDPKPLAFQIMAAHKHLTAQKGVPAPKNLSEAIGAGTDEKPKKCGDLDKGPRQDYCYARNYVVMFFNGESKSQTGAKKTPQAQLSGAQRIPSALAKGYDSEVHLLNAEKAQIDGSKAGKEEIENLYMDPAYIDNVINSQYPGP